MARLLPSSLLRAGRPSSGPSHSPDDGGDVGGSPEQTDRRALRAASDAQDISYKAGIQLTGLAVLAILAAIGAFLLLKATPALRVAGAKFLTTQSWYPDSHRFGIAAVLLGTVLIAVVATTIALPLSLSVSLFISEMAPRWIRQTLITLVDLMAAVPSVVYGLWGLYFVEGHFVGIARWMAHWLGWIPLFKVPGADPTNPLGSQTVYTASTAIAGVVVGLMITPIAASIMREAFSQAPPGEREGALALGATRWGMIRTVVLPFGRGAVIGGTMLGLGRALGETIAVTLIISPLFKINWHVLSRGSISVSSLIAVRYSEAQSFDLAALFAAGLALFVLTLLVNTGAAVVVARSRSGAGTEA